MQRHKNLVLLFVVALIVVGGGTVWYSQYKKEKITKDNVEALVIQNTDKEGIKNFLKLFPVKLPIDAFDIERVEESYSSTYTDYGVNISSISYISGKDKNELSNLYLKFLIDSNFHIEENNVSTSTNILRGEKEGDDMSIIISDRASTRLVKIVFTDRK